jgi:hypothetical protein
MKLHSPSPTAFLKPTEPVRRGVIKIAILAISATFCLFATAQQSPAQQTQPTSRPSRGVATLDEVMAQLDKDHDGRVTKEEATGQYAQRFAQWDVKGKGYVTRQEIHDYRVSLGIDDNGQRTGAAAGGAGQGGRAGAGPGAGGGRRAQGANAGGAKGGGPNGAAGAAGGGQRAKPTATPVILKEPADWRFETFPVPPGFAPEVKLKGLEEARFSAGMYDTNSDHYFTYLVAITNEGELKWAAPDLKDFLEKYFRGLSTSRAQRKGVAPDVSQMVATIAPATSTDGATQLNGQMIFVDSFTDSRKVTLNVEATIISKAGAKQSFIIMLVSPSPTDSSVWKELREIGKKAAVNVP